RGIHAARLRGDVGAGEVRLAGGARRRAGRHRFRERSVSGRVRSEGRSAGRDPTRRRIRKRPSRHRSLRRTQGLIPTLFIFVYLAVVLYIGIFAFRRRAAATEGAEDYFLAGRSLGQYVFLLSLFGTNMTAFAILGSSGHAFINGIVTYGLMASSSALIIP